MDLPRLSPRVQKAMTRAADVSGGLGQHFLGVEHLFLALSEHDNAPLARAFASQGLDLPRRVRGAAPRSGPGGGWTRRADPGQAAGRGDPPGIGVGNRVLERIA